MKITITVDEKMTPHNPTNKNMPVNIICFGGSVLYCGSLLSVSLMAIPPSAQIKYYQQWWP